MSGIGSVMDLLQSSLEASNLRQQVYADNIANADTPGYQAKDVAFESLLNQSLNPAPVPTLQMGQGHVALGLQPSLNTVQPVIEQTGPSTVQNNGNNVDIETQMANLAENQIRYNALSQDIMMRYSRMKEVLTGM